MTLLRVPALFFLTIPALLLMGHAPAAAADEAEQEALLETVETEIDHLEHLFKKRSTMPEDLTAWLGIVAERYKTLPSEEGEDLRDDIMELLVEGLDTVRLNGEHNIRLPANVKSAALIGQLADELTARQSKRMAKRVRRMMERLPRARYDVESEYIDALAMLLARLGHESSIEFLKDEYLRTEERMIPYIRAAMRSIASFETISPKMRHALVEEAVVRYAPLETAANTSTNDSATIAKKRVWDQIRTDVIQMMQAAARTPMDAERRALNTVKQFQDWLRDHDNYRKAPWTQPKKKADEAAS